MPHMIKNGVNPDMSVPETNLISDSQMGEIMRIPGMLSNLVSMSNIYADNFIEDPNDLRGLPLYLHFKEGGTVDAASFYRKWKSFGEEDGVWDFSQPIPQFTPNPPPIIKQGAEHGAPAAPVHSLAEVMGFAANTNTEVKDLKAEVDNLKIMLVKIMAAMGLK